MQGLSLFASVFINPKLQSKEYLMQKAILCLSLGLGLTFLGFTQAAFANGHRTTVRTGPNGNTQTTERTWDDGEQTTTRTGSNGNSQTTTRTVDVEEWDEIDDGEFNTTRTGPNGNS